MSGIKKFMIRILCGFIPSQSMRNVIRHSALINLFKAKRLMHKKYKFKDEIAIIAMIRNESDYLNEWINYHKLIGVSKFYIFDNESTDNTEQILQPFIDSGLVVYQYLTDAQIEKLKPKYKEQTKSHVAHWLALEQCRKSTKWVAIIDVDEFIVPKIDNNLLEFLSGFNSDISQIILGWTIFGSNGHIQKPSGLIIENYTKCGANRNGMDYINNFKSIVNPRSIILDNNHYHDVIGKTVDEFGNEFKVGANKEIILSTDVCGVNHYIVKSYSECKRKIINNKNIYTARYNDSYFKKFDVNDIENKSIFRFLPKLKQIIK